MRARSLSLGLFLSLLSFRAAPIAALDEGAPAGGGGAESAPTSVIQDLVYVPPKAFIEGKAGDRVQVTLTGYTWFPGTIVSNDLAAQRTYTVRLDPHEGRAPELWVVTPLRLRTPRAASVPTMTETTATAAVAAPSPSPSPSPEPVAAVPSPRPSHPPSPSPVPLTPPNPSPSPSPIPSHSPTPETNLSLTLTPPSDTLRLDPGVDLTLETPASTPPSSDPTAPNPDDPPAETVQPDRPLVSCPPEQRRYPRDARPDQPLIERLIQCLWERPSEPGGEGAITFDVERLDFRRTRLMSPEEIREGMHPATIAHEFYVTYTRKRHRREAIEVESGEDLYMSFVDRSGRWRVIQRESLGRPRIERIPRQ